LVAPALAGDRPAAGQREDAAAVQELAQLLAGREADVADDPGADAAELQLRQRLLEAFVDDQVGRRACVGEGLDELGAQGIRDGDAEVLDGALDRHHRCELLARAPVLGVDPPCLFEGAAHRLGRHLAVAQELAPGTRAALQERLLRLAGDRLPEVVGDGLDQAAFTPISSIGISSQPRSSRKAWWSECRRTSVPMKIPRSARRMTAYHSVDASPLPWTRCHGRGGIPSLLVNPASMSWC